MPTNLYTIHGQVPGDEFPQRGLEVRRQMGYIPYTAMTQGEMRLALLAEQARLYAAAFPDFPEYRTAYAMLENALHQGVSNGIKFIGRLDGDLLQQVAREISTASRQTRSASRGGIIGRDAVGIHIGDGPIVNIVAEKDCVQYATKEANKRFHKNKDWNWWQGVFPTSGERKFYKEAKAKCQLNLDIEKIFNANIENSSHHVIYKSLDKAYPGIHDNFVRTKRLFHLTGISGLSNAAEIDNSLTQMWTETAILRKNTAVGAGTRGSVDSSLLLSPDPAAELAKYLAFQKTRGISGIGEPLSVTLLAVGKIVAAIGTAIAAAALFQSKLNEKKNGVMSAAKGFGTEEFAADKTDWDKGSDDPDTTTSTSSNFVPLALAGAAAYFLLND